MLQLFKVYNRNLSLSYLDVYNFLILEIRRNPIIGYFCNNLLREKLFK